MPVNLLPPDAKALAKKSSLRRTVYLITTISLVGYLITVAGVGGWWLFLSLRHTQLQNEIATLSGQVSQKATQEVLLRQEAARISQIDAIVKRRLDLTKIIDKMVFSEAGLSITGWNFAESTFLANILLSASSSGSLESYGTKLLANFDSVSMPSVSRLFNAWNGEINLNVLKKP